WNGWVGKVVRDWKGTWRGGKGVGGGVGGGSGEGGMPGLGGGSWAMEGGKTGRRGCGKMECECTRTGSDEVV
ncbi:unnamed protein product, partial [Staurois parvus]